jgi:hypothetical protein
MTPVTGTSRSIGHRVAIAALVVLSGVQLAGCATQLAEGEARLRNQEVARIARGSDWLHGRAEHLGDLTVHGVKAPVFGYGWIEPGRHRVDVPATWSNKFEDRTELAFDAQAGKKYVVLIYEIAPGQNRAAIEIRPLTFGERLLRNNDLSGSVLGAVVLLVALPWIVADLSKDPPKSRPFAGCCFVWIQDEQSGAVVAGISPAPSSK